MNWKTFTRATSILANAKAGRTPSVSVLFKVQTLKGKNITYFKDSSVNSDIIVLLPSASFFVAKGKHMEQDGFNYINLVEK